MTAGFQVGNPIFPIRGFRKATICTMTLPGQYLRGREVLNAVTRRFNVRARKSNVCIHSFLKEKGVTVTQERIVITPAAIPDSVKRFLDAGDVDVIISDGKERYRLLFDTLSAHHEGHNVAVFVENEFFSREIVPFYPQLNLGFFKKLDIHAACRRAGKRAGKLLMQIIKNGEKKIFDSEEYN